MKTVVESESLINLHNYRRESTVVTETQPHQQPVRVEWCMTTGSDGPPDTWREARATIEISAVLSLLDPSARERVLAAVRTISGGGSNMILAGVLRRLTQDEILP